jgi:hypothetical protein
MCYVTVSMRSQNEVATYAHIRSDSLPKWDGGLDRK